MVRAMLASRLIDELHLFVYPLTRSKTTAVGDCSYTISLFVGGAPIAFMFSL
jgi:hypothetical protein